MTSGTVRRLGIKPLHDPEEGPNAELYITWSDGNPVQLDKKIGQITYRKVLVWSGDDVTYISDWVEI